MPSLENGVFKAAVYDHTGALISTIYYVKMSIVGELKQDMGDYWASFVKGRFEQDIGQFERTKILSVLDKDAESKKSVEWNCKSLSSNSPPLSIYRWMTEEAVLRMHGNHRADFPHYTTSDQSFYTDQAITWMGLGFLSGKRLNALLIP